MLEVHEQVIREIRQWSADIVIAPRRMISIPIIVYTDVLVEDLS